MSQDRYDSEVTPSNREQTLGEFMREVWSGRVFVFGGLMIGLVLAFVMMSSAVPHFRAEMILAPASPMNMAASPVNYAGGALEQNSEVMSFTRFEVSFKGVPPAALLLRDPEITDGLARDKAFSFSRPEQGWSAEKLAEYIARRVEVDPVGETSLRALRYLHPDKEFAALFLQRLHNITDGLIRHGIRREVNERITYLNKAIAENMNPEHRRALTALLMEQERLKMLVSIDQPYAASIVVPASVSVKARWPDGSLIYSGFAFVGALLGFVVFSARGVCREDIFAVFPGGKVKQQEWFFPESGNNNEKPSFAAGRRPLTGKKRDQDPDEDSDLPSEAAE
ncbi:MAG TPA: hypothetical protein PK513_04760 [Alphaproteobacteria bacterium]|nr:MAG: hypothetical protein H6859_10985 [Rhodospirillales bacterium]HOO81792.1 hypothetical protein [Alphaproteobacteria bacterium]